MKRTLARCGWWTTSLLFALIFLAGQADVKAIPVYGVTTTNQLVTFDTATPGTVTTVGAISGLQSGENILGIDFRPSNGQLYALGSTSRLYTINITTGAATQVGTGTFSTAISGTDFAFDFNPVPDAIRVVSNTGQNLRVNPNTAAVTVDTPLNPGSPQVTAAGYTNSFAGAVNTMLYYIDTNTDTLLISSNPNGGVVANVGALGVNATAVNGFDIAATTNQGFAALQIGTGNSQFYSINLQTGAATAIGAIGSGVVLRGIAISTAGGAPPGPVPVGARASRVLDYDGDGRTDFAVFRTNATTNTGTFFVSLSSTTNINNFIVQQFGRGTDEQAPGDYDGDGRTDFAVFRREGNTGTFFVLRSTNNSLQTVQFGFATDEPVARDYDGDGRTDFAVVRRTPPSGGNPGTLTWFILQSTAGLRTVQFGSNTDVLAPGDYDGDGRFDLGVFRAGTGGGPATFFVRQSTAGDRAVQFGLGSDLVVPGDYDGDGRTDFAVLRQGTVYRWFVLRSSDNTAFGIQFGEKPQLSAQGDYDGDGRTDFAVFDPRSGTFFVARSVSAVSLQFSRTFGQGGDYPVANFNTF